ncbi:hypothetical protein ACFV4T_06715 [Streptomyces sp. NPDC059755]|uniref:hypothetical protein n=1 Tax=Streptomyces sp. NPDC059755 TaxID=3346934 RepID=UPI00365266A8
MDAGAGDRLAVLVQYWMATTEQMHLITVPRARLHQCTPVPVGRRRAVEPVQEEWRRHYPVFPRLLFVLDGTGPTRSRPARRRPQPL